MASTDTQFDEFRYPADFRDYVGALRRRKGRAFVCGGIVLLVSLALAFGLPSVYESEGIILIEQQEIPTELVQSTITTFVDQRLQIISQRVMTTKNLVDLIEKYNLYPEKRERQPIEVVVSDMREDDISLTPLQADVVDTRTGRSSTATISFNISYKSESPTFAQKVTSELVSLFLQENLRSRTEMAEETSVFLAKESEKIQQEIIELETALAEFKQANLESLPELSQLNMQLMDRTDTSIVDVENQLRSLDERRIYLESELAQIDPYSTMFSETGQRILGPADRLTVLETEYLTLIATYSDQHPDVIKIKNEIDGLRLKVGKTRDAGELRTQLEGLRAELATGQERFSQHHPDVKRLTRSVAILERELAKAEVAPPRTTAELRPDNPAYIQLKARLDATESERSAYQGRLDDLKSKLADYEARLTLAPQVERGYRALIRDFENAVQKDQEIKAKLQNAKLAESLESERKGERFTLIEPPLLPEKPVSPNRSAIAFLGIILSLAGGIGAVAVSEGLDTSVRDAKGVTRTLGTAPLATIPFIQTSADRRNKVIIRIVWGIGILLAGLVAVVLFHFFVMPLDVAWFKTMGRLGI